MTLIDLYRSGGSLLTGQQVLRDFDLAVANSGGSLVLGGLIKDLPLGDIRRYFEDAETRAAIFAPRPSWAAGAVARLWRGTARRRYSSIAKLEALRTLLNAESGEPGIGDLTLDALRTRTRLPTQIMITAFDYDRRRDIVFRSNIKSRAADFSMPAIATLAEAIHASTTPPLGFFDAPAAVSRGRRCWDGALGGLANPVLAAVAEALANGVEPQRIQVLSLGAGSLALPLASGNEDRATAKLVEQRGAAGGVADLERVAETLVEDPPDAASLLAHLALGQAVPREAGQAVSDGVVVRMNPLIQPIRVPNGWVRPAGLIEAEDESDEFVRLRRLGIDAVAEREIALIRKFCTLWHNDAVVNQPIRANADTFDCEIGHRWYSQARAHWQALAQARPSSGTPPAGSSSGTASAPRSMPPARLGPKPN